MSDDDKIRALFREPVSQEEQIDDSIPALATNTEELVAAAQKETATKDIVSLFCGRMWTGLLEMMAKAPKTEDEK